MHGRVLDRALAALCHEAWCLGAQCSVARCSLLTAHILMRLQTYSSRHISVFMTYRCRARWRQHSEPPPSQQSNIGRGRAPLPPASLPTICVSTFRTAERHGEKEDSLQVGFVSDSG